MLRCNYTIRKSWGARKPVLELYLEYDPEAEIFFEKTQWICQGKIMAASASHRFTLPEYLGECLSFPKDIILERQGARAFKGTVLLPVKNREAARKAAEEIASFVLEKVAWACVLQGKRRLEERGSAA